MALMANQTKRKRMLMMKMTEMTQMTRTQMMAGTMMKTMRTTVTVPGASAAACP